jgi:hypothetical protein
MNLQKQKSVYFEKYDKNNPDISDYITKRLEPRIDWYDKKATSNLKRFNIFQIFILGSSSLISIVNVISLSELDFTIRVVSAILGGLIAAITGIVQLTKAQESWILYRSTAETLVREYNLYMLRSGDYAEDILTDDIKRNKTFIEKCESIMSTESTKYFSLRQQEKTSKVANSPRNTTSAASSDSK